MLKLENNKLQNHISNYAQSLKEKSKELEAMEHLSEENQYLHKREAFLCNQLINQTELFNKLKTTKYIDDQLWQEIKEKINTQMPEYKHIKEIQVTDEPLIKTTTQKVKRYQEMKKISSNV